MLLAGAACAQDISGDWQGNLADGARQLRVVFRIAKTDGGARTATMYSIDESSDSIPVDSVTFTHANFKLSVDAMHLTYRGKLSRDATLVKGTARRYNRLLPLELRRATRETAYQFTPVNHRVQFINVDTNVNLEVLDWGGSGRPVILLTGLGNDAHVYDQFAPKLTGAYHVYGITRRGFGASSAPPPTGNAYDADRLGDDVLAVIDSLKLNKPVLVGHSVAGEELSSVGSRHPEKVSGLIYLDAAQPYAFYDRERGDFDLDWKEIQRKVEQMKSAPMLRGESASAIQELLDTSLPAFERDLRDVQKNWDAMPEALRAFLASRPAPRPPTPGPFAAIIAGAQKYTNIPVPILAIFAVPSHLGSMAASDPAVRADFEASMKASIEAWAKVVERGLPSARVVRIPNADHYVFQSNEADVLREMNAFIGSLP
ncbi:Putative hydrolase or acyltransferase of alpha/beta superfamily (modular protein) [Candidatus Sulfopaludibacter sp. SbA3]|nr:Putative hydrolase or acyltransferase of alpha/beta superfamily (modular protein) [Candidatus Sulfopaludibacter sp. SbA3]